MDIYNEIKNLMPNPYTKNQLYTDGKKVFYSTGRAIHVLASAKSKELGVYAVKDYIINKNNTTKLHGVKIFTTKADLQDYVHGLPIINPAD